MLKFGLLLILINIFLKIVIGIGLWKQAMEFKSGNEMAVNLGGVIPENNEMNGEENTGRVFPNEEEGGNDIDLRDSNQGSNE